MDGVDTGNSHMRFHDVTSLSYVNLFFLCVRTNVGYSVVTELKH